MVGLCELAGHLMVEAALDELFLKDICDVMYAGSDVDWKPNEAWKHSEHVVP